MRTPTVAILVAALGGLLATVIYAATFLLGVAIITAPTPAPTVTVTAPATPQEDEPGFDCRIHGDLTCGPVTTPIAR